MVKKGVITKEERSVSLDKEVIKVINLRRGHILFSTYINLLLRKALGLKIKKGK